MQTPHVDRMAREGVVFYRAYVTAPVCSPCRSALVTGIYQTSRGAHNHRSSRGTVKIYLPPEVKTISEYFREEGYYVSNLELRKTGLWDIDGKTDYNFVYNAEDLYDGADWPQKPHRPVQIPLAHPPRSHKCYPVYSIFHNA